MLITSRSFTEYTAMFDLTPTELAGRLLDCCAGASSFVAESRDKGIAAVGVDPAYALPASELFAAISNDSTTASAMVSDNSGSFVWNWYGSPRRREEMRVEAGVSFLDDFERHRDSYVAGALPALPFRDGSFHLVLCSHLLFTWSNRLDADWHLLALLEMVRVSQSEARVFPLVVQGSGAPVPFLHEICDTLDREGILAEIRSVPYEFQRGAKEMLVLRKAGSTI